MTNERQAPRDNALADYGTPEWIAEFRGIVDRQADSTEDFVVSYEDVIGLFDALEAMTKRCEKAEEDYQFYHREWESACERWNYSQEQLAEVTKERDALNDLSDLQHKNFIRALQQRDELKSGHLADLQLLGSQIDQIAAITSERDDLKAMLIRLNEHVFPGETDSIDSARKVLGEIDRLAKKLQYFEETVCYDHRKIMLVERPNVGEPQLAIEPQKVTDIVYQNQALAKERDAWKLMAKKLALGLRYHEKESEPIFAEFAEMVKERG